MRILLQCVRTHNYVQDVDSWTSVQEQALEFTSLVPALDFVLQYGLKDIHPVIDWHDSAAEVQSSTQNAAPEPAAV